MRVEWKLVINGRYVPWEIDWNGETAAMIPRRSLSRTKREMSKED